MKSPKKNHKKIPRWILVAAVVAGGVSCASFLAGYTYGKSASPKYATENDAVVYLYNHSVIDSVSENNVVLSLKIGAFKYEYTLSNNAVSRNTLPLDEVFALPAHDDFFEYEKYREMVEILKPTMEFAAGTIGGSTFINTLKSLRDDAGKTVRTMSKAEGTAWYVPVGYVAVAILGVSGGVFGYKLGYDEEEKLENPVVKQALLDANNWRRFAETLRACEINKTVPKVLREDENGLDAQKRKNEFHRNPKRSRFVQRLGFSNEATGGVGHPPITFCKGHCAIKH